jgi:hypothetical protein
MGALSALPIISAGNLCCCLWVICGGLIAAYVLDQNEPAAIPPADGALVGLLAGIVGAFVYLVISIPVSILIAPMERAMMERVIESGRVPPEFRDYIGSYVGGPMQVLVGFIFMLCAGAVFSTLGGLLGSFIFKKPIPPGTIDIPVQPS